MRKALNDNPVVQAAVIGVLALVIAVFLLTPERAAPGRARY